MCAVASTDNVSYLLKRTDLAKKEEYTITSHSHIVGGTLRGKVSVFLCSAIYTELRFVRDVMFKKNNSLGAKVRLYAVLKMKPPFPQRKTVS